MVSKNIPCWIALILVAMILSVLGPVPGQAQGTSRTFPETGKTVRGRFLEYWNTHGGLAQQGYPISEVMQEISDTDGKSYTVQYFERAVFEAHPEFAPPNDVLLSLLGMFRYNQKYPETGGARNQTVNSEPGARLFPETGKTVGGLFLKYWNEHGGLAQQGYPISDEFVEVSDLNGKPYKVQYFQRAVFEYHPEYTAPYDVLLSQLGTFRYKQKYGGGPGPGPAPNPTTAPAPGASLTATPVPSATFTYTPEPTDTDTPEPRPTKTPTPVPTTCPTLAFSSLECRRDGGATSIAIIWNVTGGGGQIEGTLTIEVEGRPPRTESVSGRSGWWNQALPCIPFYRSAPLTYVGFSLELHDECGQSLSGSCGGDIYPQPCP